MVTRQVGRWELEEELDSGGNGSVFRARSADEVAAIKIPHRKLWSGIGYGRFKSEVETLKKCSGIQGVVRVLDYCFPEQPSRDRPPWFAMTLAEPLQLDLPLREGVKVLRDIAETLAAMHAVGVSHRDIKPSNLFVVEGRGTVGDLGLAHFEGKDAHTAAGEKLGPAFYIAPEMLNDAARSDGRAADVYSFAKTLWVLATGQWFPLPGHNDRTVPALTISAYLNVPGCATLDRVIDAATHPTPQERISMSEVASELHHWLSPVVEAPTSRLDFRGLMADVRQNAEKVGLLRQAETTRSLRHEAAGQRLREGLQTSANAIQIALEESGLTDVHLAIDQICYGYRLFAEIPFDGTHGTGRFEIQVLLTGFSDAGMMKVSSEHKLKVSTARDGGKTHMLWSDDVEYLEAGPKEQQALTDICVRIEENLRESLRRAIAICADECKRTRP